MVSYAIGDEFFVAMFLYGGIENGIAVSSEDEARAELERVSGLSDTSIVVVKKGIIGDESVFSRIRADARMPMIAVVNPGDDVE